MKTEADKASEHDCPSCDQGKLQLVTIDFAATLPDGKELIVPSLSCEQCDACGERAFDKAARQLIDAAIAKAMGTLMPDQVEKFVAMTGLREDELCECLGLGAKTIYRWRRGAQRPSQSLSILLAMVAHHPNLLDWVSRQGWKSDASVRPEPARSKNLAVQLLVRPTAVVIQTPRLNRRSTIRLTTPRGKTGELVRQHSRRTANPVSSFFQLAC
jgi:putative zinc finger/helix-turn-helix YgiT family protein